MLLRRPNPVSKPTSSPKRMPVMPLVTTATNPSSRPDRTAARSAMRRRPRGVDWKSTRLYSSYAYVPVTVFFFLMIRRPPRSTLFPDPTLCRSVEFVELPLDPDAVAADELCFQADEFAEAHAGHALGHHGDKLVVAARQDRGPLGDEKEAEGV